METLSIKDFYNKKNSKKKYDYYDRYKDAIENYFYFNNDKFEKKDNFYIFKFNKIKILSLNDLLRIKYQESYKYRELWKERVLNLVKLNNIQKISTPISMEVLYINKQNRMLDYDASVACLKFIIDGFVKSGLIEDDTQNHLPIVLTKTVVNKELEDNSMIILIKPIDSINSFYSNEFNTIINQV